MCVILTVGPLMPGSPGFPYKQNTSQIQYMYVTLHVVKCCTQAMFIYFLTSQKKKKISD